MCKLNWINQIQYISYICSTVFKCKGPNGEDCCVKKISLVKANEATTVQHTDMIKKEIYLLQNLNHPRIIRFLTHFTLPSDNNFYIVMEYASNGSLSKSLVARRARVQFLSENVRSIINISSLYIIMYILTISWSVCGLGNFALPHRYNNGRRIFTHERCHSQRFENGKHFDWWK